MICCGSVADVLSVRPVADVRRDDRPTTFESMSRRLLPATIVVAIMLSACGGADEQGDDVAASGTEIPAPPASPEQVSGSVDFGAADETGSNGVATDEATGEETASEETADDELFPDVIGATATFDGATWTIAATLSSPYDSPERYADGWRVVGPDGNVYGERFLTHDHASEQPFTRSESGIEIPGDVTEVTIEGRDQLSGYGGQVFLLSLST